VRLHKEIGRALGDVLEGLKAFGLFQKPKHAGRFKRNTLCWASKRKPKFQSKLQSKIQSSKIGSLSGLDMGCGSGSYLVLDAGCGAPISPNPVSASPRGGFGPS
jgi:hypothetical protein